MLCFSCRNGMACADVGRLLQCRPFPVARYGGRACMEQDCWRILIVEDDLRLAELTRDYLVAHGLRVDIESDGARAAARIMDERPDLVILDLMLPGVDGLSICKQVRPAYA